MRPRHRLSQNPRISTRPNLLSSFRTSDGKIDIEKISITGKQIMDVYSQVSPLVSKFIKR
ncbi:YppG family protein [Oceanobacillus bengalensis]